MRFCICPPTVLGIPSRDRLDCLIHGNTAKVLDRVEEDIRDGIELSLDGDTWTWYPSSTDVLQAVREAINDGSINVPFYRRNTRSD